MNRSQMLAAITFIIAQQLGIPESLVQTDSKLDADLGFDDLDHVDFVMELEEEFGIELDDETFNEVTVKTVQDALNIVAKVYEKDHEKL